MKKILFILLLPLTLFGQSQKISDMTSATALTGSEYVPIVQTTNKKSTVTLLRGWASTIGTAGQLMKVNAGATALEFFTPTYLSTYPGAGIALSTGSAWGTSITDNSANWNTAFGWGDHATAGYLTALTDGNGTTANGTAVDLGGTTTNDISVSGIYDIDFIKYFDSGSDYSRFKIYNGRIDLNYFNSNVTGSETYESLLRFGDNGITNRWSKSGGAGIQTNIGDTDGVAGFQIAAVNSGYYVNTATDLVFRVNSSKQVRLNLGSDATGDILYRNSSGNLTRLGVGSNGHVLTLASGIPSWAAPSGGGLTVGTSTITSGTDTYALYNNAGVLGNRAVTGTGNSVLSTSPTLVTPILGTPSSVTLTNATGLPPTTGISGWPSNASGVLTNNGSGTLTWGAGGGGWATTGTTTLTGAATIAGSTTNTLTFQTPSLGTTYSSSYIFENPTASTSGNQQISPPKVERGYGWKTTATAASQPVEVSTYVLPVQGTTNPSLKYRWNYSINAAAPTTFMEYNTVGDVLSVPSNITFPGNGFLLSGSTSPLYIGNGASTLMSNSVIIRNQNNNANTSGTPNLLSIGGGRSFAPTSGTAVFSSSVIDMTINQTGTSSGDVYGYSVANTITSAKANTYGFYYSPSVTTIAGTEYAFNSTRGKVLINGTTITANTLFDVRGTGTTTNLIQRWADSGNTERLAIQDNGVILVGTDAGTAGQVLTSQGSGAAATWQTPVIKTTATQSATETLVVSYGNLTSSASASSSIYTNAYYSNSTVLIADFTVYAIKSDGSSSAVGKVTGRYRKNSSGTFSVDDAGTAVISDTAILASLVPEINGTNPQLLTTMGATSGTYRVSFTAVLNYTNY